MIANDVGFEAPGHLPVHRDGQIVDYYLPAYGLLGVEDATRAILVGLPLVDSSLDILVANQTVALAVHEAYFVG